MAHKFFTTDTTHTIQVNLGLFHPPRALYAFNYDEHLESGIVSDAYQTLPAYSLKSAKHWAQLTDDERAPWVGFRLLRLRHTRLLFGECVALAGDHFETAKSLYEANQADIEAANWAGHASQRELFWPTIKGTTKATAAKQLFTYAFRNYDHFNLDRRAQTRFRNEFATSLQIARSAWLADDITKAQELYHQSLVWCAFACHFLTDCFASGHMRTPRRALYDICKCIYGEDRILITMNSVCGYDLDLEKAEFVAGCYAMNMHDAENKDGLHVRVQSPSGTICTYYATGDGSLHKGFPNICWANLAVSVAGAAVMQMRFFGRADYRADVYDASNPESYIPSIMSDNPEARLQPVFPDGMSGWLWDQTGGEKRLRQTRHDAAVFALAGDLLKGLPEAGLLAFTVKEGAGAYERVNERGANQMRALDEALTRFVFRNSLSL